MWYNKLTGKMELVLLWGEWISVFGHGTSRHYVFMLSTRFVWTSGNGLSHKTWSHFLFAQYLEAYLLLWLWWTCLWYINLFLMLETGESISKIDSQHRVRAMIMYWDGVLAIWAHKDAGKHMVCENNCCLQFSNSRAVFENSRVRCCNLPGYLLVN